MGRNPNRPRYDGEVVLVAVDVGGVDLKVGVNTVEGFEEFAAMEDEDGDEDEDEDVKEEEEVEFKFPTTLDPINGEEAGPLNAYEYSTGNEDVDDDDFNCVFVREEGDEAVEEEICCCC